MFSLAADFVACSTTVEVWLHVSDRPQLETEKKQAVAEKRVIARRLRQFEDEFQQNNGR